MAVSQQLENLVQQLPDPDERGTYTENLDKARIAEVTTAIHEGGRDNVLGLIDMLGAPGSAEDVKPRYALHCLANHLLVVGDQSGREQFCLALASQLSTERPDHVKAFLCQELGWAGRVEAAPALGSLLRDAGLSGPAAMALVSIRDGAAAEFRAAWPAADGAARRHIMDGLAALAEPQSAENFASALRDEDREVRIAAAAGLANLGEASAAELLLESADEAEGWERIQAAKTCLVLAERLADAGQNVDAERIYQRLQECMSDDGDQHIREAAQAGLTAIA